MNYNNGASISFDIIKENRSDAVKEIAEGNRGLENLLNTCIDLDYPTIASCGEESYIVFEINDNTKDMLFTLCRIFLSTKKYYDSIIIRIGYIEGGISTCAFYLIENDYEINNEDIFNIINIYMKEYNKNYNLDTKEFEYSYLLSKKMGIIGFENNIEFLKMKSNSEEICEVPEYKLTIYGNSKEEIFDFVDKNLDGVVYSKENSDYLISLKYYDINNFKLLKKIKNNLVLEQNQQCFIKK